MGIYKQPSQTAQVQATPTVKFASFKPLAKELTATEVSLKLAAAKETKTKATFLAEKQPDQTQGQPLRQERLREMVSDYFITIVVPIAVGALLVRFAVLSIVEYMRKQRDMKREKETKDPDKQKRFQEDMKRLREIEKQ